MSFNEKVTRDRCRWSPEAIGLRWEFLTKPNLDNDMFRLNELYDEKIDEIKYTEAELQVIEKFLRVIDEESGME